MKIEPATNFIIQFACFIWIAQQIGWWAAIPLVMLFIILYGQFQRTDGH